MSSEVFFLAFTIIAVKYVFQVWKRICINRFNLFMLWKDVTEVTIFSEQPHNLRGAGTNQNPVF